MVYLRGNPLYRAVGPWRQHRLLEGGFALPLDHYVSRRAQAVRRPILCRAKRLPATPKRWFVPRKANNYTLPVAGQNNALNHRLTTIAGV